LHYVLYCDWSIRLLLTSYCLTFLYVPWALGPLHKLFCNALRYVKYWP